MKKNHLILEVIQNICLSSCIVFLFFIAPKLNAEPIRNPFLLDSPWPSWHRTSGAQSSTNISGPTDSVNSIVQKANYKKTGKKDFGVSPFLVISEAKYTDAPNARTVWGAGTKYLYKYSIDGKNFKFASSFKLTSFPSISWNLQGNKGSRGGQIIVPEPRGLRSSVHKNSVCFGKEPALLVMQDGTKINSPIRCVRKFEFKDSLLKDACSIPKKWKLSRFGKTASFFTTLQSGDVAVKISYSSPNFFNKKSKQYVAILDKDLTKLKSCAFIDNGSSTNAVPTEAEGDSKTAMYWALETGIVKLTYDNSKNTIVRNWKQPVNFRERTGTTPTLVGYGKDKFLVSVDSRCVVTNVITGNIKCHEDGIPSRLAIIRRDQKKPGAVTYFKLPDFIKTVENSPSAEGYTIVVANYGGYKIEPNAKGVTAVTWNTDDESWYTEWSNPTIQMNGITTISSGSNLVYSSGVEVDKNVVSKKSRRRSRIRDFRESLKRNNSNTSVYMYGLKLHTDLNGDGGEVSFRKKIGTPKCRMLDCSLLDQGNNTVINDDGSLIYSTGEELIRIFQP